MRTKIIIYSLLIFFPFVALSPFTFQFIEVSAMRVPALAAPILAVLVLCAEGSTTTAARAVVLRDTGSHRLPQWHEYIIVLDDS